MSLKRNSLEGCQMAGACVGDWREGETMGADEGKETRGEWGGGDCSVPCSSAFVLLDNNSPPPPLTPETKGTPPVWKQ